ncbi:MAG TPA: recombinase family protein [Ktedonobacteraceae bacterium]|nr:recombinase family protein [Ktedonobacteraceae bacterium]
MAYYVRESDESLANSVTISSQAKACVEYGEKQNYVLEPEHRYEEAISAYEVPYTQRRRLMAMLDAARRKEFDVLVVSEIRALSRRQVEVLVIYDMLQRYGVRLETISEKFGDDALSRAILSHRAKFVETEREQISLRIERGKADRVAIGQAPRNASTVYTHMLVDTEREVKGRYVLNREVVYTDEGGRQWSRVDVAVFFCDLLAHGGSLHGTARILNDMGIPSPRGKQWSPAALQGIVENPILYGEVYANRYKQVRRGQSKNGKRSSMLVLRPKEEWIRLPDAPAVISKETFDLIQAQIKSNKAVSSRDEKPARDAGLLRGGYIFCGVCGYRMHLNRPSAAELQRRPYESPRYQCVQSKGGNGGIVANHRTQIRMPLIERAVRERIAAILLQPALVQAIVDGIRYAQKPAVDTTSIEEFIASVDQSIQRLSQLTEYATTDDTSAELAQRVSSLEAQKRQAENLLCSITGDDAGRPAVEVELATFEAWVKRVRPFLTDPGYFEAATFDELRLAVKILGIRVTVYPTGGAWDHRYTIDVTAPGTAQKP